MPFYAVDSAPSSSWERELRVALEQLRDGEVQFIEGIRRLVSLANQPSTRDRDFDLLVSIESETDHLPSPQTRSACAAEWLRRCDEEANQVQEFYKTEVSALVVQLLQKYET